MQRTLMIRASGERFCRNGTSKKPLHLRIICPPLSLWRVILIFSSQNHPSLISHQAPITPQYTTSQVISTSNETLINLGAGIDDQEVCRDHIELTAATCNTAQAEIDYLLDSSWSSWVSTFLQSLQSQSSLNVNTVSSSTALASFSSSYKALTDDDQQSLMTASMAPRLSTSSVQDHEIMEQISNYPSSYYRLAHESNQLMMSTIRPTDQYNRSTYSDQLVRLSNCTPTSSKGPEDDSSSQERDQLAPPHADNGLIKSANDLNSSEGDPPLMAASSKCKGKQELKEDPIANPEQKTRGSKAGPVMKKAKKVRGPKLAIQMRSDVEIVEDGYKWRKYGQKALKSSPYPRSYYKCTNKHCKVKKHVQRQADEAAFVVTTYEGVHNHLGPSDQSLQVPHNTCVPAHHQAFPFISRQFLPPHPTKIFDHPQWNFSSATLASISQYLS